MNPSSLRIPLRLRLVGVLLTGMLISFSEIEAAAALACYEAVLSVDTVEQDHPCDSGSHGSNAFGCIQVGDVFLGSFAVDESILVKSGIVDTAPIFDFKLAFGNALYSTGNDNLTLRGFRNPDLGAIAPGYLIEGGQVKDLVGGIYGVGDLPFIDMHSSDIPRNRFMAYDGVTRAKGSLVLHRVAELRSCP